MVTPQGMGTAQGAEMDVDVAMTVTTYFGYIATPSMVLKIEI